jgi:hypothetical protein
MFFHPSLPKVIPPPQYSQVIIISPNIGETGAPQLGHLSDTTPEGAMVSLAREAIEEETVGAAACPLPDGMSAEDEVADPHLWQNAASSGSPDPQLAQ